MVVNSDTLGAKGCTCRCVVVAAAVGSLEHLAPLQVEHHGIVACTVTFPVPAWDEERVS